MDIRDTAESPVTVVTVVVESLDTAEVAFQDTAAIQEVVSAATQATAAVAFRDTAVTLEAACRGIAAAVVFQDTVVFQDIVVQALSIHLLLATKPGLRIP